MIYLINSLLVSITLDADLYEFLLSFYWHTVRDKSKYEYSLVSILSGNSSNDHLRELFRSNIRRAWICVWRYLRGLIQWHARIHCCGWKHRSLIRWNIIFTNHRSFSLSECLLQYSFALKWRNCYTVFIRASLKCDFHEGRLLYRKFAMLLSFSLVVERKIRSIGIFRNVLFVVLILHWKFSAVRELFISSKI